MKNLLRSFWKIDTTTWEQERYVQDSGFLFYRLVLSGIHKYVFVFCFFCLFTYCCFFFSVKSKLPSLRRSTDSNRTEVTGEEEEDSGAVEEEEVFICWVYKPL